MIIDYTYFKGDIYIPNLNKTEVLENLNNFIAEYEKKILIDLLGYDLYKNFTEGIEADSPAQKWLDLRDGKEYTVDYDGSEYTVKWAGLKNAEKESLLAYFTYFYLVRSGAISLTGIGAVVNQSDNSNTVSPSSRIINAWNKGVELYGSKQSVHTKENIVINGNTYFMPSGYNYLKPTAYNFLYNHMDDYEKWVFTEKSFINNFGI